MEGSSWLKACVVGNYCQKGLAEFAKEFGQKLPNIRAVIARRETRQETDFSLNRG
jgi:hypothetical protein